MSPVNTLTSCGSSSSDVRRRKEPTRVLRGSSGAAHVAYVGTGGVLLPLLLFSSARANSAFTPLNYRLSADGLRQLIDRLPDPLAHGRAGGLPLTQRVE